MYSDFGGLESAEQTLQITMSITRFTISEKHNVLTYLEDAVLQLLNHKEDNPNVSPAKFFSD